MKKHTAKITSKSIQQSGLPNDYKKAISEYVWNGFDAGASVLFIKYNANSIGHLDYLSISDNGSGINISNLNETFGNFLDSLKDKSYSTNFVKGKKGKGRYAFSTFCNKAIWETTYEREDIGKSLSYSIQINKDDSEYYRVSEEKKIESKNSGTIVHFNDFYNLTGDLLDDGAFVDYLAYEFGWFLFLNKNRGYKILVNDVEVNYMNIIVDSHDFNEDIDGNHFKISYIRWKENIGDKYFYYFLNEDKYEVDKKHTSFNNKTSDFHHSLYIESKYFNNFHRTKEDIPTIGFSHNQQDSTYRKLIKVLNEFVSEKEKEFIRIDKAAELIVNYNKNKIFPKFKSNPYDQIRKKDLENIVKELYCVQPKIFQGLKNPQKKTIVGFLNLLLDSEERENVLNIIQNVVSLSEAERKDLSEALNNTKLTHVTSLIKFLENRHKVICALKALVYDLEKFTTERNHIQKVIESNYWLFGEQYHLVSADKNFEVLLSNYMEFVERTGKKPNIIKLNKKNSLRRPDIFICQQMEVPDLTSNEYNMEENIIVELKRPGIKIGMEQYRQIEVYLRYIIDEPQFNSQQRRWKFYLIGKSIDDYIKDLYESNKEKGKKFLVHSVRNYEMYAMTWDDIFKIYQLKHKNLVDRLEFKDIILDELKENGIEFNSEASDTITGDVTDI